MPMYDYKCPQCGHDTEKIIPYSERDEQIQCSQCTSILQRQLAAPVGSGGEAHGFLRQGRGFNG